MSRTAVIVSVAEDSRALCRLCMIYHEYFFNIFIPNNTFRICAEEAIHDLLSLKVAVGDGLPSNICHQCVKKLMEFRDFKEMCLKTAAELRKCDLDNLFNCHSKEELGSFENALPVKEEGNDGGNYTEVGVPATALTSVALDPLAIDAMALKEEAQEPTGTAGEGNGVSDTSPRNPIQVTEVFVPVPDQLAMGIVRHVQEDAWPTELIVKEEIGEGLDCSENDIPVVSLSNVNVDPLAVDTTIDIKVGDDIRNGDSSLYIEVRREDGLLEDEGSGNECSDGGAPLSETKPENQVDCCNYIGGIPDVPEIYLDKIVSGMQEHLQHQLPSSSSYDFMQVKNFQYKYSTANSLAAHCHSGTVVKTKEDKMPSDPNNISSLSNDLKQLKCDCCGKTFISRFQLMGHTVIHTGVKPFKCNVCEKNFAQNSDLKKQLLIHTGVKPFKCNVCGKNFTEKGSLNRHLLIHNGVKRFKCNVCGKYFSEKGSVKRHLLIHTGVKPYKCAVCGKTFTRNGGLAQHSVVHTGEKPFNCNECGKNFYQKSDLKRHLLIHTGVKPFTCNVCGKNFIDKHRLNTHMGIHSAMKPYRCDLCGKEYRWKRNFRGHRCTHSSLKPPK